MEESDVLQHLLHVENEAATLASEAQNEADKRVAEHERMARERYNASYGGRVASLESDFQRRSREIDADYRTELNAFSSELKRKSVDQERFSSLVREYLFGAP